MEPCVLNGTLCLEWNLVVELDEISVFNGTLCSMICLEWNLVVELDEISVLNGTLCSVISVHIYAMFCDSRKLTCSWHINSNIYMPYMPAYICHICHNNIYNPEQHLI